MNLAATVVSRIIFLMINRQEPLHSLQQIIVSELKIFLKEWAPWKESVHFFIFTVGIESGDVRLREYAHSGNFCAEKYTEKLD